MAALAPRVTAEIRLHRMPPGPAHKICHLINDIISRVYPSHCHLIDDKYPGGPDFDGAQNLRAFSACAAFTRTPYALVNRRPAHPHCFPSFTREGAPAVLTTTGSNQGHPALRGGSLSGPNHSARHVDKTVLLLREAGLPLVVMIDCSHANSARKPDQQVQVASATAAQVGAGQRAIIGVMIESNIVGGRQHHKEGQKLVHGQSMTDGSLAFAGTVPVLENLARAATARRSLAAQA
ncbi:MAG: hypothetical protein PHQ04_06595 [Opitutaceae bacterium]|nr:hypothetical protein [Opitutaceae bacterium]